MKKLTIGIAIVVALVAAAFAAPKGSGRPVAEEESHSPKAIFWYPTAGLADDLNKILSKPEYRGYAPTVMTERDGGIYILLAYTGK